MLEKPYDNVQIRKRRVQYGFGLQKKNIQRGMERHLPKGLQRRQTILASDQENGRDRLFEQHVINSSNVLNCLRSRQIRTQAHNIDNTLRPSQMSRKHVEAQFTRRLLIISITAFCTVSALMQSSSASTTRECSWNGSAPTKSKITSTPEFLEIQWGNGRITKLKTTTPREFRDANGATWYKMSNSDFLGLWSEDGASRREIFCR